MDGRPKRAAVVCIGSESKFCRIHDPKIGPASVMQELRSRLIEWIGVLKGLLLSALGTKVSFVAYMTQNYM